MERLLNVDELSEILGVTKATIYSWIYKDKVPHIKLNNRLLKFKETEILGWLEKMSIKTIEKENFTKKIGRCNKPKSFLCGNDILERMIQKAQDEVLS